MDFKAELKRFVDAHGRAMNQRRDLEMRLEASKTVVTALGAKIEVLSEIIKITDGSLEQEGSSKGEGTPDANDKGATVEESE